MSYIISNLPKVAIWSCNGFRIRPHIAEKNTTLLFNGTLGHTVHQIRLVVGVSALSTTTCTIDRQKLPLLAKVSYELLTITGLDLTFTRTPKSVTDEWGNRVWTGKRVDSHR